MKKLFFLLSFVLVCSTLALSQNMFSAINGKKLQDSCNEYLIGKDKIKISYGKDNKNDINIALKSKNTITYNNEEIHQQLRYKVFANQKLNSAYIFIEKFDEMSLGCKVYFVDNGIISFIDNMDIAAYTKENGDRMNYTSILPYLSIIKMKDRVILSLDTQFLVLNPMQPNEKIINCKDRYFLIEDNKISLK
jgi:hypothetical protein